MLGFVYNLKKSIKKIVLLVFCVFLLFSFFIVIFLDSKKTKTEIILKDVIEEYIDSPCFIFREETVIETPINFLVFNIKDGEKIESGREIATIYQSEDDCKKNLEVKKIEQEIENLEKLKNKYSGTKLGSNSIQKTITENIKIIKQNLIDNEYLKISKIHKDLNETFFFLNDISNTPDEVFSRIHELSKKKEVIEKSLKEKGQKKIISSASGYFSNFTDGFENSLNINKTKGLKIKDLENLLSTDNPESKNKAKIVKDHFWYLILKIPNEKARNINKDDVVYVSAISGNFSYIPAQVISINADENNNYSILVLKSDYITKEILKLRKENIRIKIKSYEGLKFSKKALREKIVPKLVKDNSGNEKMINRPVFGVNVLENKLNKKITFKEVEIVYSDENYVICKQEDNENSLKIYDEIVVD